MEDRSIGKIKIPTEKSGLQQNFSVDSDFFRTAKKRRKMNGYQRQFLNIKKNIVRRIV